MSQLQRKTQFGVEGTIQPTMQITWGIYRRIPDAGGTWRKEVLGAYPDAHTAQSCLRMLLIGRGYDIDAANSSGRLCHADRTRAGGSPHDRDGPETTTQRAPCTAERKGDSMNELTPDDFVVPDGQELVGKPVMGTVTADTMNAITLWQPWASLIAQGHKQIETRSWRPPLSAIRQPIAIHAAKRLVKPNDVDEEARRKVEQLMGWDWYLTSISYGAVVATATLKAAIKISPSAYDDYELIVINEVKKTVAERTGTVIDFPPHEHLFGDFTPGRWLWILTDVQPVDPPQPARGKEGIWQWEPSEKPIHELYEESR